MEEYQKEMISLLKRVLPAPVNPEGLLIKMGQALELLERVKNEAGMPPHSHGDRGNQMAVNATQFPNTLLLSLSLYEDIRAFLASGGLT
jgi:hypothetical protein